MNLLLDTHIFLWWAIEPQNLSPHIYRVLQNPGNTLLVSVVSMWEMQIKAQIGKLHLSLSVKELVAGQRANNQIQTLLVLEQHIWALELLPLHHRDPFDRLLVAQAITENCQLVTIDSAFARYPVKLVS